MLIPVLPGMESVGRGLTGMSRAGQQGRVTPIRGLVSFLDFNLALFISTLGCFGLVARSEVP